MKVIHRGKENYYDRGTANKWASEMLNALGYSEELNYAKTITYEQAHSEIVIAIMEHVSTGDWYTIYANDLDISSDGRVIRWQYVRIGETSEDHSVFDDLLHYEIRRIAIKSYQISDQYSQRIGLKFHFDNMRDRGDIEGLIEGLNNSGDTEARRLAAKALGTIRDARAVGPLIEQLSDPQTLASAAEALGAIGDARAVDPLAKLVENKHAEPEVMAALVKLGAAPARPLLEIAIDRRRGGSVAHVLVQALVQSPGIFTAEDLELCNRIADGYYNPDKGSYHCSNIRRLAREELIRRGLVDFSADWTAREFRVLELGKNKDTNNLNQLVEALKDEYWKVRKAAILGLVNIGDTRAVEPLTVLLNDEYWDLRAAVAEALGNLGDAQARVALTAALEDRDERVRLAASNALKKLK